MQEKGKFMTSFTKNIALLKGIAQGFSADGTPLSGIVRVERYGAHLMVECQIPNLAPITDGRIEIGISDGQRTQIIEGRTFEGDSALDIGAGFAALVCYINGSVKPIAKAVCGNFEGAVSLIQKEMESAEGNVAGAEYRDEAIAEENYFEYDKACKGGGAVCKGEAQEKEGHKPCKNEEDCGTFQVEDESLAGGENSNKSFFEGVKAEVERVLLSYPKERELCNLVENSDWVKISYDGEKYYVFGVIYEGAEPKYICYGVPAYIGSAPPESMRHIATFLQIDDTQGYWVMYQDPKTGAAIEIE
jgi:hypothetical protein